MQVHAWWWVVCDVCEARHKLGSEHQISKLAESIRLFTSDPTVTDSTALLVLAHAAGYITTFSEDVHRCEACRARKAEAARELATRVDAREVPHGDTK